MGKGGVGRRRAIRVIALATMLGCAGVAFAADEPSLEGTYMQNKPCRGDATDVKALLVTITAQEIVYGGGTCAISDRRQEGEKITLRATCKTRAGKVMAGDISFSVRDDKTLQMTDQDRNYNAVLNRCPPAADAPAPTQPGGSGEQPEPKR
jgi:hypothetical protein